MDSTMYFGMGFYWVVPVVVVGLAVWSLVTLLSTDTTKKANNPKD